jgi:DNA-binding response OmpR family regulator
MSPPSTSPSAFIGPRLRIIVVTLDPESNDSRADSPACLLRALGHEVVVSGFDLTELEAQPVPADVVIIEAGEHLEIGRGVIQRLRQRPALIASRILLALEVARVVAFTAEVGADDFILSPISLQELAARLWQLRARDKRPRAPLQLRYGEIVLDCEMRQAYRDDQSLRLTPYEYQLFRFLVDRINCVFSRQELLSRVWGYRHAGARTVETHVLNLRKKLGDHGERLQSVLGVGYKLQPIDAPPTPTATAVRAAPTVYVQRVAGQNRPKLPREVVPQTSARSYGFDRLPVPVSRRPS